jgi:hypothetical protein
MMRPLAWSPVRLAMAMLFAAGCGGHDDVTGPPPDDQPVASVELSPNPASVAVDRTIQLTAVTRAGDGSPLSGRAVTWRSSNEGVATVSATGVVTGVAAGNATITGTSEGKSGTAAMTVTATVTGGRRLQWIGGAPGPSDWSVATHWNPAAVPGAADTARIPAADGFPVLSRNVQIARLILAGGPLRTAGHSLTIRQP